MKIQELLAVVCYVAEKVVNEKSEIAIFDGIEVKLVVLMHEIAKIGLLALNKKVVPQGNLPMSHNMRLQIKFYIPCYLKPFSFSLWNPQR